MALRAILKHTATPLVEVAGEWVEGERRPEQVRGEAFPAVLFLPSKGMEDRRGRVIVEPQVMYLPFYPPSPAGSGDAIVLNVGEEVAIVAAEHNAAFGLAADAEVVWTVTARPQPLGKPGCQPKAILSVLRGVED